MMETFWNMIVKVFGNWKVWLAGGFIGCLISGIFDAYIAIYQNVAMWSISKAISILGASPEATIEYTGVAGYLADCLRFPECLAVITTGIVTKISLKALPSWFRV
jgi:hypothetical protein